MLVEEDWHVLVRILQRFGDAGALAPEHRDEVGPTLICTRLRRTVPPVWSVLARRAQEGRHEPSECGSVEAWERWSIPMGSAANCILRRGHANDACLRSELFTGGVRHS